MGDPGLERRIISRIGYRSQVRGFRFGEHIIEVAGVAYPSPKGPCFMTMIEAKHPFRAAGLAAAVRRARRAFVLGRGRGEALGLGLAAAGPMGIVGLFPFAEPPANDALPISRLALSAVARVATWPPVVACTSDSNGVFAKAHESAHNRKPR